MAMMAMMAMRRMRRMRNFFTYFTATAGWYLLTEFSWLLEISLWHVWTNFKSRITCEECGACEDLSDSQTDSWPTQVDNHAAFN
jgi:hypothetical protein